MRIDTTVHTPELSAILRGMFAIAPWNMWRIRIQELGRREKENPHLSEYLDERYILEMTLARARDYHRATSRYPSVGDSSNLAYYDLYSFAAAVVRTYSCLSSRGQQRLRGYLKDGIQTDTGLAPVATEMTVVTHLSAAGFDIEFTDAEGLGRFDFLARKQGAELEVDCKTISGDIGRPIHRSKALMFFRRIDKAIDIFHTRGGGAAIQVTIPDSLHGSNEYVDRISKIVLIAAREDANQHVEGFATVQLHRFQLDRSPFNQSVPPTGATFRQFIEELTGFGNTEAVARCTPGTAATIASIRSEKPSKVVDGIYRSLKKSSECQFSRNRPALLAVLLTDIRESQLLELAKERQNGLAAIASRLFLGDQRQHLHSIAFLSRSQSLASTQLDMSYQVSTHAGGSVLLFNNHHHPLSEDNRLQVFRVVAR